MNFFNYLLKSIGIGFRNGAGLISDSQAEYENALVTIQSADTSDYDAVKSMKDFMYKYDRLGTSRQSKELANALFEYRPKAAKLLANK